MNIETKIERFSETVRREATMLHEQKMSEMDKKLERSVSEYEKTAIRKYKEMEQDAEIQAEKKKQREISAANAEIKKSLMQTRSEYVQKVFDNVLNNLLEYFESPDYKKMLIDVINGYKSSGTEITAQIMRRDAHLKDSIEKGTAVKVVTVDEDFLGGVKIILDKNRIADCTMRTKFEAEKAKFNKIKIM